MAERENLTRKRRVRAANHAYVTRMITQVQELLSAEGGADPPKLKRKRQALAVKTELLNKLDEEIVEVVHESELEEVEVADTVREWIELIIIELDSALNVAADRSCSFIPEHPEPFVGDSTLEPLHDPPHHERGESLHHDVPPDHPSSEEMPHEMRSSMTVPADPLLPADPSSVELPASSPRVKLPKLSLKKFNGDLTKWMTFWDTFESAVHNNTALTSIDQV